MRAIVRDIPATFADALAANPVAIDVALAAEQHAAYRSALESMGVAVTALAREDALADSCFVEDTAVIANGVALITRPGAPSRRAETASVQTALAAVMDVHPMHAPATLDGGDCMRVGNTIYVGRSARSNDAGIEALTALGLRVVALEMPAGVLHLKCVCSPLGEGRILLAEGSIPPITFSGVQTVMIPEEESYAANVVAIGRGVLVAKGYPKTLAVLVAQGFEPRVLDTSEIRKADGALTCLSLLY